MAKGKSGKGGAVASQKVSFGKRMSGRHKKSYSKYSERPKKYRGQGR